MHTHISVRLLPRAASKLARVRNTSHEETMCSGCVRSQRFARCAGIEPAPLSPFSSYQTTSAEGGAAQPAHQLDGTRLAAAPASTAQHGQAPEYAALDSDRLQQASNLASAPLPHDAGSLDRGLSALQKNILNRQLSFSSRDSIGGHDSTGS